MIKRIIFFSSVALSGVLILVLVFLKLNKRLEDDMNALIQSSVLQNETSTVEGKNRNSAELDANKTGVLSQEDGEVFITSITADINEDGLEDEVIAINKPVSPSVYLVFAVQTSQKGLYKRVLEIKTNVLVPQSLFFYTIQLQNSLPAIVCEGIGTNRDKTFSMYLIKEDLNRADANRTDNSFALSFKTIAQFSSDIQIQLQDRRTTTIGQLDDYSIETYSFVESGENGFNQIRREYRWDANVAQFLKVSEEQIKGKREEDSKLKNLKGASLETYKKHFSGLWYMPRTVGENARYLYYDKKANHLIFHVGSVQEIFEINNMFARSLGLSILTVNSAIPTIKRRIEVEINNAEELQLKVIEDVATLRINATSPWSGLYRRRQNTFNQELQEASAGYKELKAIINNSIATWVSEESTLKLNHSTYNLKSGKKEEKGFIHVIDLNGKYGIEMKSVNNKRTLFVAELEHIKDEEGDIPKVTLKLTPASLNFAKVELKGKSIVFTELAD